MLISELSPLSMGAMQCGLVLCSYNIPHSSHCVAISSVRYVPERRVALLRAPSDLLPLFATRLLPAPFTRWVLVIPCARNLGQLSPQLHAHSVLLRVGDERYGMATLAAGARLAEHYSHTYLPESIWFLSELPPILLPCPFITGFVTTCLCVFETVTRSHQSDFPFGVCNAPPAVDAAPSFYF